MSIYRRLYEKLHGPIPIDEDGRTYDIHHIDGNRENNDPSNLVALSIDEHYKVHYEQGDYGAALRVIARKEITPEMLSEISTKTQRQRVEEGTHHFIGGEIQRQRIKEGNHPFSGKTNPVYKMVEEGTHHFIGGEIQRRNARKLVEEGTHHLLGGKLQKKQLESGKHPSQIERTCPHCGKVGKGGGMMLRHFDNCKEKKS